MGLSKNNAVYLSSINKMRIVNSMGKMKQWYRQMKRWYKGKYIPPRPDHSIILISRGYYQKPSLAKLISHIITFLKKYWGVVISIMIGIICILITI